MKEQILQLFTHNNQLKFSDIEKRLDVRSNKLAYYLKLLIATGVIKKEHGIYVLAEDYEHLIPYISQKQSALPVILIHMGDEKHALLYQRRKKPYLGYLGLPGGRLIVGESIDSAAKRIVKEKCNIDINKIKVKSVNLEHIKKHGKTIHTFFLITVSASTKAKIALSDIKKNKLKIIPSDRKLIQSDSQPIKINTIYS